METHLASDGGVSVIEPTWSWTAGRPPGDPDEPLAPQLWLVYYDCYTNLARAGLREMRPGVRRGLAVGVAEVDVEEVRS
ncbi:MAG: hypothetical protein H0U65_10535 [Rubrobacter sp.]|jgi:hypothetical protein|nr:hypothetical protein [Rubrobacter sp.]